MNENQILTFIEILKEVSNITDIISYQLKNKKYNDCAEKYCKFKMTLKGNLNVEGYQIIEMLDNHENSFLHKKGSVFTSGVEEKNSNAFILKGKIYFN